MDRWGGKVDWNRTCRGRSSDWEIKGIVTQSLPGKDLGMPGVLQETGIVMPDAEPVRPDLGRHAPDSHELLGA